MVGMARRAVPARVVAGGTNIRATLAIEEVAPLHAARTSQRDVPTTLNKYPPHRRRAGEREKISGGCVKMRPERPSPDTEMDGREEGTIDLAASQRVSSR